MTRGCVHDQVVIDRALPTRAHAYPCDIVPVFIDAAEQQLSGNGRSRLSHPHRPYGDLRTVDQKLGAVLMLKRRVHQGCELQERAGVVTV